MIVGIGWYMQRLVIDYNKGVEQAGTSGTEENASVKVAKASVLAQQGETQDAIDLMLKTIKENPKNLEPQLKLAQLYVLNCKKQQVNCEDALWQLSVILKIDSTNAPAKQLLQEIKMYTHPKKPN
jgi:thioredoxin-like negative regulator of GroEL